jgi:hypothetical protein
VNGNSAGLDGGGMQNEKFAILTINGGAQVNNNTAAIVGGGIHNFGAVTMNGSSSVTGNTAGSTGGGIFNEAGASLAGAVAGVNVASNIPDDIAP